MWISDIFTEQDENNLSLYEGELIVCEKKGTKKQLEMKIIS